MKWFTHAPSRIARYVASLLAICACAVSAQELPATANSIQSLEAGSAANGALVLKVTLQNMPSKVPESLSTDTPPRIIIDLPNTSNGLGRSHQEFSNDGLRSVDVIQGEDRTRLILNLNQPLKSNARLDGNDLLISLQAAPVSSSAPTTQFAPAVVSAQKHNLRDVDFHRGKSGEGRIQVDLSDTGIGMDVRQQGKNLVIDFPKTSLPSNLQRKLDVVDFATPVQMIDTFTQGDSVRMVIEPKGAWEYASYQTDTRLIIEIKPVMEDPNKLVKSSRPGYAGEKLSLNFQNITVREALNVIADFTGLNIVISDSVTGSLTLRLKEVPWDQALDIIMQSRGLDMRKHGNVIQIAPREELSAKEKLELTAKQEISELESLHTESIQLNYQQADAVALILANEKQRILSKRGSAVIDSRTNTIFVQDTATQLEAVRKLVRQIDVPVRQVLIEARVVEASDKFSRSLGARLTGSTGPNGFGIGNMKGAVGVGGVPGATNITVNGVNTGLTSTNVNLPVANAAGAFSFILANAAATKFIGMELSASEVDNTSRIISSPRVVTADQSEAIIEQGTEIPYQAIQTAGGAAMTTVMFKKASLSLKVKPQITPDENVIMHVSITKDTVGTLVVNGVPTVDTNKVDTQVLVENGGTVVIGGVHTQTQSNLVNKVPGLGDIPVLGNLFKNTVRVDNKGELLIFLSPKVLKNNLNLR
ncbi:MAG: type IV pilus secretin PilQ [Nitrosomonadales bacterium]|nr:type IV pilus secretin PilQ [Nitrosomonadales bacterium]